jgi:HEPN domain-containing protein
MKTLNTEKTVSYWLEGAKYDLGVANAMFKSKKYPYALFMGHLSLENFSRHLLLGIQKHTLHSAIHFPT